MALVHKSVGGYRQKSWNCGANDGDPGLAKRSVDWVSMLFSLVLAFIFCEYNHIYRLQRKISLSNSCGGMFTC